MKLNSLVDPKKRELVREAIRKKDASLLMRKKPAEEPARSAKPQGKLNHGSGLDVLIKNDPGATMEEALARAEKEKRVIASNIRMDQALIGSAEWESIKEGLGCWTGTMTAYEEPGKPFGEVVEYIDSGTKLKYLFPVPQNYRGKTDCILVAEHPDYSLEIKGDERIIRAAVVDLIERFPAKSGWYLADPKHGIPFGDLVGKSDSNTRYLYRRKKRVGLSARGYGGYCVDDGGRFVGLGNPPSSAFGVAVECPVSGVQFSVSGSGSGSAIKK